MSENVTFRVNLLESQSEALLNVPRTLTFNVKKALAPALSDPMWILGIAGRRIDQALANTPMTDLDGPKRPTSLAMPKEDYDKLMMISIATNIPRDTMVRLALDYYLNHTLKEGITDK